MIRLPGEILQIWLKLTGIISMSGRFIGSEESSSVGVGVTVRKLESKSRVWTKIDNSRTGPSSRPIPKNTQRKNSLMMDHGCA